MQTIQTKREQYNDLLFQYTGLKETSNSPEELEEAMLKTVDEAVEKFLHDEKDNLSLVDIEKIKKTYIGFRRTLPEFGKANTYDKLNVLSIFAASIFQYYLFLNEGMLVRMRQKTDVLKTLLDNGIRVCQERMNQTQEKDESNKAAKIEYYSNKIRQVEDIIKKKIKKNGIYANQYTHILFEIFNSETYFDLYLLIRKDVSFSLFLKTESDIHNNWNVVIKRDATSLPIIMTAFCKKVFFAGLQTKEIFAHEEILTPLTYLAHDGEHYDIISNKTSNKPRYDHTRCSQFIQFIQKKYERDNDSLTFVYNFLYAYLFETIEHFDKSYIPLGYENENGIFEYKTTWRDVFSFYISYDVFLIVYDVACKPENNYFLTRMTNPYDLQGILPKQMKSEQITKNVNAKEFITLVSTYNKQCVLLFLQNYYEFMVLLNIEGLGYVDGIELNCENGTLRNTSSIRGTYKNIPSIKRFEQKKGGKRTKKGRNKKSKKSKQ